MAQPALFSLTGEETRHGDLPYKKKTMKNEQTTDPTNDETEDTKEQDEPSLWEALLHED